MVCEHEGDAWRDGKSAFEMHKSQEWKAAPVACAQKKLGFSLNELTGGSVKSKTPKKPTQKAAPKYANPADASQTWTGRGRRPAWVISALEAGKSLDDMAI